MGIKDGKAHLQDEPPSVRGKENYLRVYKA